MSISPSINDQMRRKTLYEPKVEQSIFSEDEDKGRDFPMP